LRPHDRQGRLRHPQGAEEVGLELRSDVVFRQLLNRSEVAVARIVDNQIEPAQIVGGLPYGLEVGRPVSDVELNRQDRVAIGVDQRFEGFKVSSGGRNLVASLEGSFRPFTSKTLRCTGKESLLSAPAPGSQTQVWGKVTKESLPGSW
jgi:hypothetical protein